MEAIFEHLPRLQPGWVWLTGAGPGDPGLLTLHALNGLRQADVVVHDALIGPEILGFVGPGCELIDAGKRGGRPGCPAQQDISLRLVELAREGKRVLRLKGGDPFVFGRGVEEALTLVEAGIPFRIVPGVSAAIGALAYAGIPLTHRDTNSIVTFVTGHGVGGRIPEGIDWPAVCAGSQVIVFYMALRKVAPLRDILLAHGRLPSEPVAVVCRGTLDTQKVVESTLADCAEAVEAAGLEPPAIIVIGDIVRLRPGLDWLGALAGRALIADPLGERGGRKAG